MTIEQFEEIDARLIALETIIALLAPLGAEEKEFILANLREQIRDMRSLNAHAAAIETYERVVALIDNAAELPPGSLEGRVP